MLSAKQPAPPTTVQPGQTGLQLGEAHHLLLTVAYNGNPPTNDNKIQYGKHGINKAYIFECGNYQVQAHKRKLEIWVRGITGDTSGELLAKTRGQARKLLGGFAQDHRLSLDWPSLSVKTDMHITLTPPHRPADTMVQKAIRQEPDKALSTLGMVAGDRSHPDNTEFLGKLGAISFDGLSYAIKGLPSDMNEIKAALGGFAEYNANIRKHLAVLDEMSITLKQIREALKK